ncbi:MAG: type II toxin-antitoxin system VapC family toxin [Lentisphaerae bacterium]|jgi:predicted nucleic acid-binding protein|nr:type II toxin-antitoxin system VapC family toxin [Lentisphaerota bacterium]
MLIDSDVLIWASRGNEKAVRKLNKESGFGISAVTYMELCQGMRNKSELDSFRKALKIWNVRVIPINETISYQAMFFVERYCLSHSLFLADALIAATANQLGEALLSANTKHYSMIPEITLKAFRPE